MPPFQPSAYAIAKNMMWARGVKNIKHSSIDIFKNYWEEFNTMRVPILGEDRFFEIALELEHMATDEEDLKRLLLERRKLWEKECYFPEEEVLCEDARRTARRASQTGSLQHFLELLNGVVCGWEADEVQDTARSALQENAVKYGASAQPDYNAYVEEMLDSGDFYL
ncbi:hypothetical protein MKX08_004059 [Trichoderma sp. CBMAI-0020]|nr:hypothetical protein MKX08_004059 [Trichoderma sp. CBMAI-0020]